MHLGRCCHCANPPVPWPGVINRFVYPTAIADYEELSDEEWEVGDFFETFNGAAATPQFGGGEFECYYYVASVANQATDTLEVIMQPLRYAVETVATDDEFDYWTKGTAEDPVAPQWLDVNNHQPLTSNGYLPVSGNSHISDGEPATLRLIDVLDFGGWLHVWRLYGGWNPTINFTPLPLSQNWEVSARYIQLRQNGSPVGSLFDMEPYWVIQRMLTWGSANALMGRNSTVGPTLPPRGYSLAYPSSPLAVSYPSLLQDYTLDITAGDVLECDIWYQIRSRPSSAQQTAGERKVVASIARHITSTDERRKTLDTARYAGVPATSQTKEMRLTDMKVSDGFNPATHTYTFEAVGGSWNFGDGSAGPHKAESGSGWNAPVITSQRLVWEGSLDGTGSGGLDFVASYDNPFAGVERLELLILTVAVGSTITLQFTGGGATFSYESTTTTPSTFVTSMNAALATFIADQGADGYWETAFPFTAGDTLIVDYADTIGQLVPSAGTGGPLGGAPISVFLDWIDEICVLQIEIAATISNPAKRWRFRPQNSSDYVTQITDRVDGSLTSSPCGVFAHLGTTTFFPWFGTRDASDTDPADTDRPTSIVVVKANQ